MNTVTAQMGTVTKAQCGNNVTGFNQITTSNVINKSQAMVATLGNTVSGGGNEVFMFQQAITAGNSATIDLSAMTDALNVAVVPVRIKCWQIQVLSATDDPTISPAPNANSTATVTNIGPAAPSPIDVSNGGSGLTVDVGVVGGALNTIAINVAGSGYPKSSFFMANVNQANGADGGFAVITNSGGIPVSISTIANAAGSNYTNAANVATTVLGQYNVLTGGCHQYIDPKAAGFLLVSSTSKNVKIRNMDGTNAITIQVAAFGATS